MKKVIYIQILFLAIIILNSCKKTGLIVDFSFDGNYATSVPAEVHFTNKTEGAINYTWDFGDATPSSNEKNPVHIYTKKNIYTVTLSATNSAGDFKKITKTIAVGIAPPVINFANGDSATKKEFESYYLEAIIYSDSSTTLKSVLVFEELGNSGSSNLIVNNSNIAAIGYSYKRNIIVPVHVSQVTYEFQATDAKGITTIKNFTLLISPASGPWGKIHTHAGTMDNEFKMGGNQFWSVKNDTNYDMQSAKNTASEIDFVFGHRSVAFGGAFLAAPNSGDAKAIYDNAGTNKLSSWSVLNSTLFQLTNVTPAMYGACNNDSLILYQTSDLLFNSNRGIRNGDVIAFVTASGKRGLMYVKSVIGNFETQLGGTLEFEYKIQK